MRTRDEMLVDVLESRRSYAWLMEAEDMLVIRLAMDVTDLLETVAEKDADIQELETQWQTSYSRAVRNAHDELADTWALVYALESAIDNADCHTDVGPTLVMLREEVDELAEALSGTHEHQPEYELAQIAGIAINWLRNIGIAPPPRRDLHAELAERDAEIERLKADLAQSRSAITKLSREIWKVC